MQFLGACEVCGRLVRNYVALSQHFRFHNDPDHAELKSRWQEWKDSYRATLRCRKCGSLWEITDIDLKDSKRCPRCEDFRQTMSKRKYEAWHPNILDDPRKMMASGSKSQWDGLTDRNVHWEKGDSLYLSVLGAFLEGRKVSTVMQDLGITYKVYRGILVDALGEDEYRTDSRQRIRARTIRMAKRAHEVWAALSPEEKAARLSKLKHGSQLERRFSDDLVQSGFALPMEYNKWQSVPVRGCLVPREADIKISLGDGRKVVVLCDGEAFHGPRYIFGDPGLRVAADIDTARGYFDLGYSVVRYSESEIKSGDAKRHLLDCIKKLGTVHKMLRLWHPATEETVLQQVNTG